MQDMTDFVLNGRPLRRQAADPAPASTSASKLALATAFGQDATLALATTHGDFSVAAVKADGTATLAVDRFSMRTLCWRVDNGQLRFAEQAHELADNSTELDPQAIFDYLFFHAIPSPRTVWKGIHRLPPGHLLQFDGNTAKVEPYWRPTFDDSGDGDLATRFAQFRQLLEDATKAQLDGGKAGCFLSGGTDSSTIAGMIGRAAGKSAATYSIGFDAEGYDEMAFARLAAKHFGTEHHEYYVTPEDLVEHIPLVAASYDQPFGNSSALPAYCCARMARADGVTRILAGDGGDELFGGNTRYAKQRLFNYYDGVPLGVRETLIEPWARSGLAKAVPGMRKLSSYVEQARLGLPARLESYNLLRRLGMDQVLTRTFVDAISVDDVDRQMAQVWGFAAAKHPLNRHLAFDWRYTLAENDLPKVRGTTELAGLQVGFPMLDQRLVEFSLAMPVKDKLRGSRLRWFFKEALRGFLPDDILTKKKQGFGLPFGPWAVRHKGLSQLANDSLHSLAERGIVQQGFVQSLMRDRLPEHPGYYGEMVWILMMLEQWLRKHAPGYRLGGRDDSARAPSRTAAKPHAQTV
jgi:asparagine synthase (glutamine-hydrolysing)